MRKDTRFKFNAYLSRVAELNGVSTDDVAKKFTVEPSVTQTLMTTLQMSSAFLTKINIVPVDELKGEKVGVGVNGTIASTTDTTGDNERKTADFTALESNKYECAQINFDFHIRYKQLDLWARFQDFQTRIRDAIIKRQSLDFIMAGFNGTTRAETSNRKNNPLLQDVAVGWLQKYRNEAPARVMSKVTDEDGTVISDVIRVGKNGDYANLDALVMDATSNLIDEIYQDDPELVVITGRKLMADKYFPIVNQEQANTESLAADIIISQKRIGNLPAVRVPYFPADGLMVTRLDNLSIYFMDDAHRRAIIEEPKKDRVENYESMNIDYVVEAYAAGCLIENIKLGDFTPPAAPESASAPANNEGGE
ncbi:phage major capsid protein, P2 family [Enterobacter asburiae]|uniref:phage major capsid protein, P2 family n=1 Tax=Enterobacter asburiae TaxID=61645 RepID=UPI00064B4A0E|nr:phage major capsid protein, P2 family [Enterobacter asburiae]KLP68081.1 capsid protein [Enterobacter asburiae]KUQ24688.1 capsid protein [Enterobacter asburiae]